MMYWYIIERTIFMVYTSLTIRLQTPGIDELVAENQLMWIKRCRSSAIVVSILWLTWIIIVQFAIPDAFPESWFVKVPDQGEYTGW